MEAESTYKHQPKYKHSYLYYIYVYILHTCEDIFIFIYININLYVCMYVCMYAYIYIYTYAPPRAMIHHAKVFFTKHRISVMYVYVASSLSHGMLESLIHGCPSDERTKIPIRITETLD